VRLIVALVLVVGCASSDSFDDDAASVVVTTNEFGEAIVEQPDQAIADARRICRLSDQRFDEAVTALLVRSDPLLEVVRAGCPDRFD
jgi:hypothetical protein